MDTSKNTPLIIAAVVWILLLVTPLARSVPLLWFLLFVGIPVGGAFYIRNRRSKLEPDPVSIVKRPGLSPANLPLLSGRRLMASRPSKSLALARACRLAAFCL
jgi:hypothetical protein